MDIHNPLGLTDAQLRASAVPISGTVAVTGAGDASAANQATQIARADTLNAKDFATQTTLAALNTKVPAQGAAVVAGSLPVTMATNQTAIPISAATLPLPSGAAQDATLQTISGQLGGTLNTAIIGTATVQITSQPVQVSGSITAASTAVATNSLPKYVEGASSALSQTLEGMLRVLTAVDPARNNKLLDGVCPRGMFEGEETNTTRTTRLSWGQHGSELFT